MGSMGRKGYLLGKNPGSQVYSFIELFGGTAWVSRCMKSAGHAVASFDILYGHPKPNKQDCMDLLTDAGFTLLCRKLPEFS